MGLCGVVAEYNPLHAGHVHQLRQAKELSGGAHVAVIMSGSFVQRGEPACFDKWLRTRWALHSGADIVFELPTAYVLQSAQNFAAGAIRTLCATGLLTHISFGTEHDDLENLLRAADCADSPAYSQLVREYSQSGMGYPAASRAVFAKLMPDLAPWVDSPNFLLGMSYVRASRQCSPSPMVLPVLRKGAEHQSSEFCGEYSSASAFRQALAAGDTDALCALPDCVFRSIANKKPATLESLSQAILYRLRTASAEELSRLCGADEGLDRLLMQAAEEPTLSCAFARLRSKRYSDARLRRLLCAALLHFSAELRDEVNARPPYLRVLGVRSEARQLFGALRQNATLPVVIQKSDADALRGAARDSYALDLRASDIAALCDPSSGYARRDWTEPLIVV